MIIVEGPDGGGKSTLIAEIEKSFNMKSKHFGAHPKTIEELHQRVIDSRGEELLDRWSPISEQIYGPLRNKTFSIDLLDHYILTERPFIIYCRPHRQILITNKIRCLEATKAHKTFAHIQMVSENYEKVMDGYDQVMRKLAKRIKIYEYDYTKLQALPDLLTYLGKRL